MRYSTNRSPNQLTLADIISQARMHLELERSYGVDQVPFDAERVRGMAAQRRSASAASRSRNKQAALDVLCRALEATCCCDLGKTRTNLVFGAGSPDAHLMFVGEAPGFHEDQQGIPFIGPAGQLLTSIIQAIGLTREQVYIANVLKCRPPDNRNPLPDEAAACVPHLLKQIEIIQPSIIVTLGNPATQALLRTKQGITKLRGTFQDWNGIQVMPTFHPSYLLRNVAAKAPVWADMQKVHTRMKELGLPIGELRKAKR